MKRANSLRRLSSDHHQTLVLAKRLDRVARHGDSDEFIADCAELRRQFDEVLAAHFRLEEEKLLPLLAEAGEAELVEQTRREHRYLEDLVAAIACLPTRELLASFAEAIESHVRFEENYLFQAAQAKLSEDVLATALSGQP